MVATSQRYRPLLKLAAGGMASVYVGTVQGALGFRQLVAIKKPHPHILDDETFRKELIAEARLASMIHHANVVDVRDVEIDGESISLVMDYIEGASLGEMLVEASKRGVLLSPRVVVRIILDALAGLHSAHELLDERGRHMNLVHRDVSPQNILVGSDGTSRVADFGVAKFARRNRANTAEGNLKGKLAYMAPEYLRGGSIDRRFDVFGMGVVLWESLLTRRCFGGDNQADTLDLILHHQPRPVGAEIEELTPLDPIIFRALAKTPEERFSSAAEMSAALETAAAAANLVGSSSEVKASLMELLGANIEARRAQIRAELANEPSLGSESRVVTAPAYEPTGMTDVPSVVHDSRAPAPTPRPYVERPPPVTGTLVSPGAYRVDPVVHSSSPPTLIADRSSSTLLLASPQKAHEPHVVTETSFQAPPYGAPPSQPISLPPSAAPRRGVLPWAAGGLVIVAALGAWMGRTSIHPASSAQPSSAPPSSAPPSALVTSVAPSPIVSAVPTTETPATPTAAPISCATRATPLASARPGARLRPKAPRAPTTEPSAKPPPPPPNPYSGGE